MRYCVVVYGIFAYFRTQEKAEKFINALPIQSQETSVTQSPPNTNSNKPDSDRFGARSRHIEGFRNVLKHEFPPRGYIKLLNRRGEAVSSVETNLFDLKHDISVNNNNNNNNSNNNSKGKDDWKMSIIHKNRKFDLKCESKESLTYWFESFQNIGVKVTNYPNINNSSLDDKENEKKETSKNSQIFNSILRYESKQ